MSGMTLTDSLKLDSMARGAVLERFDNAMLEAMANILDPNTVAQAKRKVVITLELKPNEERNMCAVTAQVQTKLQPRMAVSTTLAVGEDQDGSVVFKEFTPGMNPGQHTLPVSEETKALAKKMSGEDVKLTVVK